MYKVLVADDSLTIRKWIVEVLEKYPQFTVVGEAKNGKEAIAMAESLKPDIITMDMMMPLMTGVAATEYIMAHCPTRILIVSASLNRGGLLKTYDALNAGAISLVDKPTDMDNTGAWEKRLIDELNIVGRVPVVHHLRGMHYHPKPAAARPTGPGKTNGFKILVIGASTGGPQVLMELFRCLTKDFPLPIICVLHLSATFTGSLAEWFNSNCGLHVTFAKNGDNLLNANKGRVFLAPPDHHVIVEGSTIKLTKTPPRNFCRPSVDVLFESVSHHWGDRAIAVLLTGMGKDGAVGMKAIRDNGGYTIAQDENTCTVFGMPKEAIELGAARKILPNTKIPDELVRLL